LNNAGSPAPPFPIGYNRTGKFSEKSDRTAVGTGQLHIRDEYMVTT